MRKSVPAHACNLIPAAQYLRMSDDYPTRRKSRKLDHRLSKSTHCPLFHNSILVIG